MHIGSQLTEVARSSRRSKRLRLRRRVEGEVWHHVFLRRWVAIASSTRMRSQAVRRVWDAHRSAHADSRRKFNGAALRPLLQPLGLKILLEPAPLHGRQRRRAAVARRATSSAGRGKNFLIVDGRDERSIRPAMYESFHEIVPLQRDTSRRALVADVVGPICESGDCFAKDRQLQERARASCSVHERGRLWLRDGEPLQHAVMPRRFW